MEVWVISAQSGWIWTVEVEVWYICFVWLEMDRGGVKEARHGGDYLDFDHD